MNSNLVTVNWLKTHLNDDNITLLDASIPKVTVDKTYTKTETIPGALFFDLKGKFSNTGAKFPNTIPTELAFQEEVRNLGITKNSVIVVFDNLGIYSSARVWWLFKTFGHSSVYVLNGGLIEWKKAGLNTTTNYITSNTTGDFEAEYNPTKVAFFESILDLSEDVTTTIIDARSSGRFNGNQPEPREGLRSGAIPNSKNLPYEKVLNQGRLKSKEELKSLFRDLTLNDNLVFTCGSGITASILDLAAQELGYINTSVYDGSWTEYATLIP